MRLVRASVVLAAAVALLLVALAPFGCSSEGSTLVCPQTAGAGGSPEGGSGGDGWGLQGGEAGSGGEGPTICEEQDITLSLAGVRVMLLVDFSSSMYEGFKWFQARSAVQTMMEDPLNADTWFGLDVFPKPATIDWCQFDGDEPVPLGPGTHGDIVDWMADHLPNPINFGTPMVNTIEHYMLDPTSPLHNDETANYIVVISDGEDNCYLGGGIFTGDDKRHMLAGIVHDLKDVAGIKTIAIGFGSGVDEAELNTIAENGGSSFTSYIDADDQAELEAALLEISQAIRPCRYRLDSPDASADPSKVNFYFDGNLVARDLTETDGWNWTQSSELEVEFFGSACQAIKEQTVSEVRATFGCPTKVGPNEDICAEADFFLQFPPVAVMLLQDFSGSMGDDGKWSDATEAITSMLVDDRNNSLEFGLDLFPDAEILDFCGVEPYPNVPVGKYNTFMIIDRISNNEPLGDTPLLDALTRFTYHPGRIGENGVSGALVVISDGADTCAEGGVDVVAELGNATQEIVDEHDVRVFAIGFGSGVSADELNAIAENGGTGLGQYSQADDLAQLETIFAMVSSMVTSCVFEVPYAGVNADYDRVNFYLDGVPVPRDTDHIDGWDWVNPVTMTEVEFFGSYCDMLKTGQVSDVLVEFGCDTFIPE